MLQGEGKKNDKRKESVLRVCLQLLLCLVKSAARPGGFSGVSDPSQHSVVCIPVCCIQVVLGPAGGGPGKAVSPKPVGCGEQTGVLCLVSTSDNREDSSELRGCPAPGTPDSHPKP